MSRFIVTETEPAPPAQGQDHERGEPQSPEELPSRKRDPSAAADASAEAEAAEEQLDGALSLEDGRAVGDYELYGVVHHLGAMSAGHYVSSIRSRATRKWHCFNDNVLVETTEKDLVSESAYMLFYVRKDVAAMNIEDVYPCNHEANEEFTDEDVEKLIRRRDGGRCCVS